MHPTVFFQPMERVVWLVSPDLLTPSINYSLDTTACLSYKIDFRGWANKKLWLWEAIVMPGQEFLQFITAVIKNKNPTSKSDCLLCARLRSETSLCIPCHHVTCTFCLLTSIHSVPGVFRYKTKDQLKEKLAAIFHKINTWQWQTF